jgi:hypothetical protein
VTSLLIGTAVTAADSAIATANADADSAVPIANGMVSGACANGQDVSAPNPVSAVGYSTENCANPRSPCTGVVSHAGVTILRGLSDTTGLTAELSKALA